MLVTQKISGVEALNNMLQGVLTGGADLRGKTFFVHNKTLVFNTPANTITFNTGGAQQGVPMGTLLTQIASGSSNALKATVTRDGRLLVRRVAGGAIVLDSDGTANADLGFSTTVDTSTKVYAAPGGSAPALVTIEAVPSGEDTFVIVTDE